MGQGTGAAGAGNGIGEMQFDSFAEFVAMGGHGLYVWLAYGATVAVLLISSIGLRLARRKQILELRWTLAHQDAGQKQGNVEDEPQT